MHVLAVLKRFALLTLLLAACAASPEADVGHNIQDGGAVLPNVNANPTYDANVPVPDGGDSGLAASVAALGQATADRLYYLRKLVELSGGTGVRRVRTFADIAALKANTDQNDGDFCVVGSFGLYRFIAADVTATDDVMVASPTGGTAGRWINVIYALSNVARGLLTLDANARAPSAQVGGLPAVAFGRITRTNVAATLNTGSYNIASVDGTFDTNHALKVTFSNARSSTNYLVIASLGPISFDATPLIVRATVGNTGFFILTAYNSTTGAEYDLSSSAGVDISFAVFDLDRSGTP